MKAVIERLAGLRPAMDAVAEPGIPLPMLLLEAPIDDPRKFLSTGMQRSPNLPLGKSFDTHGPIGRWITSDDLKAGDFVRVEVSGLGHIENQVELEA